jgi:uncharacterized membrane protein YjjP (DUF1212 family)
MFDPLYISTFVVGLFLAGLGVVSTKRNSAKARSNSAAHAVGASSTMRHLPGRTVAVRQSSFEEKMRHHKEISPSGMDLERVTEYQRGYVDLWKKDHEKNLAEISEGERQGTEPYHSRWMAAIRCAVEICFRGRS